MKDRLEQVKELQRKTAILQAETAKLIAENAKQLKVYAAEHDREMKEIRGLLSRPARKRKP
jgi:hypothetical protein